MGTVTVNIALDAGLLAAIDAEAKREARSRSELLREAARLYVDRRQEWERLFQLGDEITEKHGLKESDVAREIKAVRRRRRAGL